MEYHFKKRWVVSGKRLSGFWEVTAPRPVGDLSAFVEGLFATVGPLLAGFDFPIGLPEAYGTRTGLSNFPMALATFGLGTWADFYKVADLPDQITLARPFYPRAPGGKRQAHLVQGLGMGDIDALCRQCERATPERRAACPLFWTLGGNQVGKGAISGWQQVVAPALKRGARLWPFHGSLLDLVNCGQPVIAETYPAEAYGHIGIKFSGGMSKRRQADRRRAASNIAHRAQQHRIVLAADLAAELEQGFGEGADGEDRFDALAGLLGMLDVVDGRRPEGLAGSPSVREWEGWILGQNP